MKTARKEQIAMAFVMVTEGRIPTDLGKLLADMREMIGDVSEDEVRAAIKWALRRPMRPRARIVCPGLNSSDSAFPVFDEWHSPINPASLMFESFEPSF